MPMVLPALVLATGVALPSPIAGSHWHSPVAAHVDRGHGRGHPVESGRSRQHARQGMRPRALYSGPHLGDWYVVVRPQHRRLGPSAVPAQPRVLEPGLLLHSASERVGPWLRVFDSAGKSWVDVGNVRPAHEPRGWDKTVLKIHPGLAAPRVAPSPPLPVANAAPVTSAGAAAATPQPVVVQQQMVVQPVVVQPLSIEDQIVQAGDNAWGPGQGQALLWIVERESGGSPYAVNASGGACGLFQRLPCDVALGDVNGQIADGVAYVTARYGTAYAAQAFWMAHSWY